MWGGGGMAVGPNDFYCSRPLRGGSVGGGFGALRALAVRVANADILEDIIVIIITVIFDHANSNFFIGFYCREAVYAVVVVVVVMILGGGA